MKKSITSLLKRAAPFAAVALLAATAASATQWTAFVGAQSPDLGSQAQAFLPNEMWIHAGDSIHWTLNSSEIHTVTFLTATQPRPANFGMTFGVGVGCLPADPPTGNTPDGAAFDGSSCVNSGLLGQGPITVGPGLQSYSVTFPTPNNYKLSCLVHFYMQGTIHVLAAGTPLPHDQAFYDAEASKQGVSLVATTTGLRGLDDSQTEDDSRSATVTAGVGAIVTTSGAGGQQLSLVRFLQPVIVVRVGDTVEWTNHDTNEPHTVTFGQEPTDPRGPFSSRNPITLTSDGARQVVINSLSDTDTVNSGLLALAPQDRTGLPETPLGVTRFRVTFTAPGTYKYICSLHDNLGMTGTVIVH